MHRTRTAVFAAALALVLTAVPLALGALGNPVPAPATDEYAVAGPGAAAAVASVGAAVIDDHGAFVTARLEPSQARSLLFAGVTVAPLPQDTGRGAFRFDGRVGDGLVPAELRSDGEAAAGVHLVQFRGPVKAEWRAHLDSVADAVYDYVPHNSFVARLSPEAAEALAARSEVRFLGPYHAGYKLAEELPAAGESLVTVLAFKDADFGAFLADASAFATVASYATTNPLENVAKLLVDAADLPRLARHAAVSWIEPAYDEDVGTDNAASTAITMTGATNDWRVYDLGVDGSSQVTSVCDTGTNTGGGSAFSMTHEMFADSAQTLTLNVPNAAHRKVLLYYAPIENGAVRGDGDDSNGHGTHTAGTLAGDAPGLGERNKNDGFGVNSKLAVCDITIGGSFQILNDYSNYWKPAYDVGARVNSNSWGSAHTTSYTEKARQHDAYVWAHRDFNVLRSMGNTGANTIRPEAVAKSAFGIGATENGNGMENLASFSSRGPTQDNRVKPTVIAPGACLTSASLSGVAGYSCLSGTSMSTPSVAGAATLVRDYLVKGYYPDGEAGSGASVNPSSALVRAMLVNSGKEITGSNSHPAPYRPWAPQQLQSGLGANLLNTAFRTAGGDASFPNGAQGWGRVLLDDVLYFAGDARKLWFADEGAGLATGESATFTIEVADASMPLEITLAWSDYPGAAGANPAIVNDLDLVVTGSLPTPYNGNVLTNGESSPLPFKDAINLEEAVILKTPTPGTYTITVTGANVPSGPQPFALVVTGGLA